LFDKFVKKWNGGKLDKIFYSNGIDEQQTASFTSHKWSFVKKLNEKDSSILASAKDSVHVATNKAAAESGGGGGGGDKRASSSSNYSQTSSAPATSSSKQSGTFADSQSSKAADVWKSLGLEPGQRVQIAPRSD
jgi:hypothetical protein